MRSAAVVALLAVAEPSVAQESLVDLGPPGSASEAAAIHDGLVVGSVTGPSGQPRATLWTGTDLVDLGTLGGPGSAAADVSGGVVVGWSATAGGEVRAFRWQDGAMAELPTPVEGESRALAVNAAGTVAGWTLGTDGKAHVTVWKGGAATQLAPWYVPVSLHLSEAGHVAGTMYTGIQPVTTAPYLWVAGLTWTLADKGAARCLSEGGAVAGEWWTSPLGAHKGFLWSGGKLEDLGAFVPVAFAGDAPVGIVGAGGVDTSAVRTPTGLVPLGTLGGDVYAMAANASGTIAGVAIDGGARVPFVVEVSAGPAGAPVEVVGPIEAITAEPCSSSACKVVGVDAAGTVATTWMAADGHLRAMRTAIPEPPDADGDGVPDAIDVCPKTHIPEPVPLSGSLRIGRWALVDGDTTFDTNGAPAVEPFTTAATHGCSCRQIIHALKLGLVAARYGCTTADMQAFVELAAP